MVSAEFAMTMPVVAILLVLLASVCSLAINQLRAQDAAAGLARMIARGDTSVLATRITQRSLPAGSHISIRRQAGGITVNVTTPPAQPLQWLGVRNGAAATAWAAPEAPPR